FGDGFDARLMELANGFARARLDAFGDDDAASFGAQPQGGGAADALPRASDDADLVAQTHRARGFFVQNKAHGGSRLDVEAMSDDGVRVEHPTSRSLSLEQGLRNRGARLQM